MYLQLTDATVRYPYSPAELRREHPQVSFPIQIPDAVLAEFGMFPVQDTAAPEYDPTTQRVVEGPPQHQPEGWAQTWEVQELLQDEMMAHAQARRGRMLCSSAQGQLALLQAGLLDAVEAWVAAQSRAVQIEYAARGEWRRDWPLVVSAGAAMGLSAAQLDDLFLLAGTL